MILSTNADEPTETLDNSRTFAVLGYDFELPKHLSRLNEWIHIGQTTEGKPLLLEPTTSAFKEIESYIDSTTTNAASAHKARKHIETLKLASHGNARLPTEEEALSIIFPQMGTMAPLTEVTIYSDENRCLAAKGTGKNHFMEVTGLKWSDIWVEPGQETLKEIKRFSKANRYTDGHLVNDGLAEFSLQSGKTDRLVPLTHASKAPFRAVQEASEEIVHLLEELNL